MWYFIAAWIAAGVACWTGLMTYYTRALKGFGISNEEIKSIMKTGPDEIWRWAVYLVIWPVCMLAVAYNAWYKHHIVKKMIKSFVILDKES